MFVSFFFIYRKKLRFFFYFLFHFMVRFKFSRFFVYFFFGFFFWLCFWWRCCVSKQLQQPQQQQQPLVLILLVRTCPYKYMCMHACGFSLFGDDFDCCAVWVGGYAGWCNIQSLLVYKMSTLKFYVCAQPIKIVTRMLVNFLYTRYNCCPSHRVVFWKLWRFCLSIQKMKPHWHSSVR